MSPYREQDFYGDGLLTPWFPVFRLQFETGCTDSRGLRANCFLIETFSTCLQSHHSDLYNIISSLVFFS